MGLSAFVTARFGVSRSGLGSRLAAGTFWLLLGVLIYRSLTLASSIVAARLLAKETFGALGIIQSTVSMFQVFAGSALGLMATKYVAEFRKSDPARAGRIIGMSDLGALVAGCIMAALVFQSSDWLASRVLAAPSLGPLLRISSLMIILGAYNGAQTGTLSGFEAFRSIARVNLVSGLLSFPIMVFGLWRGGLTGAVWALAVSALISCFLSQIEVLKASRMHKVAIQLSRHLHDWKVLWHFYLPALLSGSMVAFIMWACNALLVRIPEGYSQMALFSAAGPWRNSIMMLPYLIIQVSLPMLSGEQTVAGVTDNFRRTTVLAQNIMMTIGFPVAAGLMFLSGPILRLYGENFTQGADVLIGVACASLLQCIGAAAGPVFESRGRMWPAAALNGTWGLIYITVVYLSVGRFGALSLAFGSAIAYLALTILNFSFLRAELPQGLFRQVVVALSAAVAMTGLCLWLPPAVRTISAVPVVLIATVLTLCTSTGRAMMAKIFNSGAS